jgi:NAD(P)-dependent dehydrogenase (short-subunit alcohol dehydrogenase family)
MCWSTMRATSTRVSFEELTPEQVRGQIETLLFGPMNVARAVLPVMRKQRSGLLLTISSTAGISGGMFCTAYAAAKFGIEGWIESLAPEIAPFGIRTMLVEPGFFRTGLLTTDSTTYAQPAIDDYAERTKETITAWSGMDGKQGGDPAKLAIAIVQLAGLDEPPTRFAAGADAVQTFEAKARTLLAQAEAHRKLSSSLAHNDT